jgi:DTW domain-containing protein YfiP
VILQHPRERDMPIGTARMASLCLPEASLHVGVRWDGHPALGALLADPSRPPILLYPSGDAVDILRAPPPGPVTLVVVDGTWSQAKSVVRDNAVLRALPRYAFAAPEPSQYRIRREPHEEYVSTIEALMYVLGALEGDAPRFRALLAPLGAMVDAQLAANRHTPRFRHRRRATASGRARPLDGRARRHRRAALGDGGSPLATFAEHVVSHRPDRGHAAGRWRRRGAGRRRAGVPAP